MKKSRFILTIILLLSNLNFLSAQCNTNTSICATGTAGPFNFVTPGTAVSTCLDWIGPSTGYIILHITTSGPLNMLIDGNGTTGFLDVAVFNIPAGQAPCNAITNTANQIGCNYASASSGCNQFGTSFPCASSVPAPNVTAGQEIMIVVENWSGASTSFTMQLANPGAQSGPPNPAITPAGPFCTTSAAVQLIAADMGGTWSGPGVSSTGMFNPATAGIGTHTINYSIGVAPCNASSSTTITVNSASISVSSPNTNICAGTSTTLNATGASSYTWTPAGTLSSSTGASVTASPTANTTYSVTGTTAGCTNTQNITISVKPNPTVNAVGNMTFCSSTAVPIISFSSPNAGATFAWTNSNTAIGLGASGTGNLPSFTATNPGTTPIVATISVTATLNGCTGPPITFTITINPSVTVNAIANQTHCAGAAIPLTSFTSNPTGATFAWTNSNTGIGLGASGTGNLPAFTATNATASAITSTISVTPTLSGCSGTPLTFTITVNPRPVATTPSNITQCGGTVSPPAFISTPIGATFAWTNSNTAIGLGASGSGNISPFTGTNATTTAISGTVSITPTLNGCVGNPVNFTITINPTPIVNSITNQTHCAGTAVPLTSFTSTPTGATFAWTNSNTGIGLGASGTGNLPTFTATNATASAITSTISVTPTLSGCSGTPLTFTITVNPRPVATPPSNITQCGGTVSPPAFISTPTGATFAWTNSNTAIGLGASGSGNISPFTGTNATSAAISGSVSITPTLNGCVGTPVNFTITIQALPTVSVPANATYCPGQSVPVSTFTTSPAGGTTTWTNSNTAIGLGASGSGNTPIFTATNATSATISGMISVTPTVSGCIGTPSTFTISVSPTPSAIANPDIVYCNGANVLSTTFSSNPTGATFTWTNSNTSIGLGANGTGNQPTFVATNSTSATITSNVTVTPTLAGCVGTTDVYVITINPTPVMTVPSAITQCGGNVIVPAFISTPSGASFTWTNTNTAIGLGASGSGNIANFNGINAGSVPNSGTISVTPTLNSCVGSPVNFNITINPTPVITPIADIVDCENVTIPATAVVVTPSSATVSWTNSNTGIGLAGSGNGNIPSFLSTNNTLAAITGTVTVNATANGCSATPELFDITINQVPVADPVAAITQCHNTTVNAVNFTSTTPGVVFNWTNSNTNIGLGASGTGNLPSFTTTNPTTSAINGTITVSPTLGTCTGAPFTFNIQVNPVPVPTAQNNGPLCPGDNLNLTATGLPGSSYAWTGPNSFVSSIQNPTITSISSNNAGTYTVTETLAGCSGTASTVFVLNPSQAPTITQVGPFCADGAMINLQSSLPGGTWSGPGIVNPVTGQFSPSLATVGNNTITYTINAPCALPATTTIVINPLPTVQFSAPVLSGCEPFTAVLTDNTVPASSSVNWDFGDGSTSNQTGTINHTFDQTGCYNITLTSTSALGCTASQTIANYICVNPYADADFGVDNSTHTVINPEFNFFNNSSNANIYSWDFGDETSSSLTNPVHEYPATPGSYTVMLAANNANNCPDTAYLTIVIEDVLIFHVPNSFTPDGDEFNNMFTPVFYSGFDPQSYTLLIYNRWGETLFESHNVEQGWNGAYHDGIVREGAYIWTIQFKDARSDKKLTYTGHVTLLK